MPQEDEPLSPIDAYKAIMDQVVSKTRPSTCANWVVSRAKYSNAPADKRFNDLVASLSDVQRRVLADLIQDSRDGAIHDLLAMLSWWMECHDVGLTVRGERVFEEVDGPVGLSGMGLHGDFIGRLEGWTWPTDRDGSGQPV